VSGVVASIVIVDRARVLDCGVSIWVVVVVVSVIVVFVSFMFPAVSRTCSITVLVPSPFVSVQVFCVMQFSYWLKFLFSFASLQLFIPNVSL